ncbi:serine/threonine-protein kinase [Pseudonocardia sp.]|uniref:serine/threonine-protein kinase n=1 Tax=Pseudonocardia sp. TaxID=60912 RepID=UPI003D139482
MSADEERSQRRIGGRYRLTGRLGSGAMGTVWSAFDEVLCRPVAVKELKVPPGLPVREAEAMRERMLREARALGGLSHPNVITVYDVVTAEGEPLVVLEMLPSRNLATVITENGALTPEQAAVVGYATAAALRAAHRRDITHRDVKPANVLVGDDGRVKLTDFGIARNAADVTMTTAGLVLGSPAYIAPEVAAGQPVKPAADLWGLGATLFAAIEGRPPYDVRGEAVATITEVVDGEVPRPRAGPVGEVVAALMVKDPSKRISLDEVRRRLRPLIPDPDDPVYPNSPVMSAIPTMTGTDGTGGLAATPMPRSIALPSPAPAPVLETGAAPAAGPLAAAPGPLPWEATGVQPAPVPPQVTAPAWRPAPTRLSSRAGAGLVLAGTAIVLAGALGGWSVTRSLAGQTVLSTMTVTAAGVDVTAHTDPLGFRVEIPDGWAEHRDGPTLVSFVSPDGAEKLVVERAASAEAVTGGLPGVLGPGAVVPLVTATPAPPGSTEFVHRAPRTSWLRILPAADGGVWVVRLTAPGGSTEGISQALFERLAGGFGPVG